MTVADGVCWLDGSILPLKEARSPVLDHGLLYGDRVFEGIRFYHGRPLLLSEHLDRLFSAAHAIAQELRWTKETLGGIIEAVRRRGADLIIAATRRLLPDGLPPASRA